MKGRSMEKMPQIKVCFILTSDNDNIDKITDKLSIMPTSVRKKDSFRVKEFACFLGVKHRIRGMQSGFYTV